MRQLLLPACLAGLLLAALATPALAGDWVEGDGYRFRLPDGFQAMDAGRIPGGVNMSFGGLGGSDIEMEMQAFGRNPASPEQGVLLVMRMLATGELGRQMREQMSFANLQAQLENDQTVDEISTVTLGAGHEAVQMNLVQFDPRMGGEVRLRMAMTTYEDSIYMFALMGPTDGETEDAVAWNTFTTSIQLSSPNRILRFAKKNWPWLLGGVLVLGFLILNLRGRGGAGRYRPAYASRAAAAGGLSRAMDGLPTYDEGDASGAPAGLGPAPLARPSPSPVLDAAPAGPAPDAPPATPAPRTGTLRRPGAGASVGLHGVPAAPASPSPRGGAAPDAGPRKRTIPLSRVEGDARGIVAARERRLAEEARASAEENPRIQGNWAE